MDENDWVVFYFTDSGNLVEHWRSGRDRAQWELNNLLCVNPKLQYGFVTEKVFNKLHMQWGAIMIKSP